ncbi:MAG TPA: divergent PAP2 family protein [Candidatus Ornithomonoglobus intestinigallinarum]|uniref:Divergent PAP2 family protein n=1 Tax=Candidatus Ornithomonoglobus intestinigallinarum TaxID=2840894 RepID=A0A9D1H4C4_9FIRM|nr:divergent PAP2 family protein [Candidatus Ornithomonoglobus intestinigallinarum]
MSFFKELWENEWLITALIGWFAAQLLKIPFTLVTEKRLMVSRFFDSGGMPSSHSAFTSALAAGVGLTEGFDSVSFALAFVLAFVVMYDAAGVRRSAGEHARILNRLTEHLRLTENGKEFDRLKTLLGHTPLEVICGAVLGIAIALIRHL